jgi:mercuric ion binding protein
MKSGFIVWLVVLMAGTGLAARAQKHPAHLQKRESIQVWGTCKCSKHDIEKAAREAGASFASFDTRANTLIVAYDLQKTNSAKIRQHITRAGYETTRLLAARETDKQLPLCCKNNSVKTDKHTCCEHKD